MYVAVAPRLFQYGLYMPDGSDASIWTFPLAYCDLADFTKCDGTRDIEKALSNPSSEPKTPSGEPVHVPGASHNDPPQTVSLSDDKPDEYIRNREGKATSPNDFARLTLAQVAKPVWTPSQRNLSVAFHGSIAVWSTHTTTPDVFRIG